MEALEQFRSEFSSHSSAQVRELIRTDAQFRQRLETLYEEVFHNKLNKGCSNCWLDAFVLLRSKSIKKLTTMAQRHFELKAGVVLRDVVNQDNAKLATHHNLTDELALYHLRTNPNCKSKFSRLPDDWEKRVAAATEADTSASAADTDNENTAEGIDASEALKKAKIAQKGAETRLRKAQAAGDEKAIEKAKAAYDKATEKLKALSAEQE